MVLTRDFKETIKKRADKSPEFREALFIEAIKLLLQGDLDTGKTVLRDYINVTVGFKKLAEEVGKPSKSLMRMFSAKGNPRANNLFSVISQLQKSTGVNLNDNSWLH